MAGKMRPAFVRLHVATLDPATTAEVLEARLQAADAVQDRHRLSEGAVYMSAQRRWTMLTGTDWRAVQQPTDAATWGDSDHRLRFREQPGGLWLRWACSCGERGECEDRATGTAAHAEHLTTVGVPA